MSAASRYDGSRDSFALTRDPSVNYLLRRPRCAADQPSSLGRSGRGRTGMPSSSSSLASSRRRLAVDLALLGLAIVDAARLLGKALADVLEVLLHVLAHLAQHRHHHRRLGLIRRLRAGGRGAAASGRRPARAREAERTTAGAIIALRTELSPQVGQVIAALAPPAGRTWRRRETSPRRCGRWLQCSEKQIIRRPLAAHRLPSSRSSPPAASSACSRPSRPDARPSTKTCGTVRRPSARATISSRRAGNCQRSISVNSTPLLLKQPLGPDSSRGTSGWCRSRPWP